MLVSFSENKPTRLALLRELMKISKNEIVLQLNILKEGDTYVAYSPALDLSSCGKTVGEAKRNFQSALNLFLEELQEMGTLDEVLLDLGWRHGNTPKFSWIPPHLLNSQIKVHLPRL